MKPLPREAAVAAAVQVLDELREVLRADPRTYKARDKFDDVSSRGNEIEIALFDQHRALLQECPAGAGEVRAKLLLLGHRQPEAYRRLLGALDEFEPLDSLEGLHWHATLCSALEDVNHNLLLQADGALTQEGRGTGVAPRFGELLPELDWLLSGAGGGSLRPQ